MKDASADNIIGSWEGSPAWAGLSPASDARAYPSQNEVSISAVCGIQANSRCRQPGQGGDADPKVHDLKAQLLHAEAAHFDKNPSGAARPLEKSSTSKRQIEEGPGQDSDAEEDIEAKRRRVLEETKDIDAASDSGSESSEESSDDEEDETAELLRELEKIKRERAEKKEQEERERAAQEQEQRESDIAMGNPLLMPNRDNDSKRRWDDDVVFRNQARGTEKKGKPEFVNDLLRSDFHKRFMVCDCRCASPRFLADQ